MSPTVSARFRFVVLPPAPSGEPIPALYEDLAELSRERSRQTLGNDDFCASPAELAAESDEHDRKAVRALVFPSGDEGATLAELSALIGVRLASNAETPTPGGSGAPADGADARGGGRGPIASLSIVMPQTDNTGSGEVNVYVRPSVPDAQELRRILLCAGIGELERLGRTTVQYWTDHTRWAERTDGDAVGLRTPVPVGGGLVSPRATPMCEILSRHGFRPALGEWTTVLDVAHANDAGVRPVPGYELVTFRSPTTPPELREELADVYALASTDMPAGDMTEEPEHWDAERVARKDRLAERSGQDWVVTAVRPAGGRIVGWTHLLLSPSVPQVAWQEGTLVRADHRGRGLASWIKRANLAALRENFPSVKRIYTFTEGNNSAVIVMNRRLGFLPRLLTVGWERRS